MTEATRLHPASASFPIFQVDGLTMSYGRGASEVRAIGHIDLDVRQGEFVSIVGPSGCGKTTLLMCMAGLRRPTRGSVRLHGNPLDGPTPGLSIVFQNYRSSLFPWYSNHENVRLALWDSEVGKAEQAARVDEALTSVGLEDVGHLYPWQLSGGMQQRVALARALVTGPEILLMDEPFASVDAQTRSRLEDLLLQVWADTGVTVLFVTHDIDEAAYISDRVVVLSSRPSTVVDTVEIGLPRPRDQLHTKSTSEFSLTRSTIFELVMGHSSGRSEDEFD